MVCIHVAGTGKPAGQHRAMESMRWSFVFLFLLSQRSLPLVPRNALRISHEPTRSMHEQWCKRVENNNSIYLHTLARWSANGERGWKTSSLSVISFEAGTASYVGNIESMEYAKNCSRCFVLKDDSIGKIGSKIKAKINKILFISSWVIGVARFLQRKLCNHVFYFKYVRKWRR